MESLGHHCGVAGVVDLENKQNVVMMTRDILEGMQKRGDLGAGLAWLKEEQDESLDRIGVLRGPGVIKDVLSSAKLSHAGAVSSLAIAHTRYATNALLEERFFQPFHYPHTKASQEFAFGFNGNIPSFGPQAAFLHEQGFEERIDGDTELLGQLVVEALRRGSKRDMRKIMQRALGDLGGAFNPVFLTGNQKMVALRDRHGRHPLVYGQMGSLVAVASEDFAIRDVWPHAKIRDIKPGQMLEVNAKKQTVDVRRLWDAEPLHCFVEEVYFADHRSRIDGTSVSNARYEAGKIHAEMDAPLIKHLLMTGDPLRPPIVVGVPDSSKTASRGFADTTGLQNIEAIKKKKGARRTFTAATDEERRARALEKYAYDPQYLQDRIVFLFDDSMVRGLTMEVVVGQMRENGAKEVHLRLASPPFLGPCFYGIDFPTVTELIARKYSDGSLQKDGTLPQEVLDRIAKDIGVDSLRYLPATTMPRMLGREDSSTTCMSCVTCQHDKNGQRLYNIANAAAKQTV